MSDSQQGYITIVSGLPRSGTSMMMQMLEAGGMPALTDGLRAADADNPAGYYELERGKKIRDDKSWLPSARGKAVKMIYALLYDLPAGYEYRVLMMRRNVDEVVASQARMLERTGRAGANLPPEKLKAVFTEHMTKVSTWLSTQPRFAVLDVDYNAMLTDPGPGIAAVNALLDARLDAQAMAAVVNPALYRNRG